MLEYFHSLRAVMRFPGYLPQPVTLKGINRWLKQFEPGDRMQVIRLLGNLIYLSEATVRKVLIEQNNALMRRLADAGLPPQKLVYVQVHDAGSSSPVMLNLLRDAAGLEQRGCHFLDSNNTLGFNRLTNELEEGALIYVDDFVGTGTQFCKARDFAAKYIEGTFSEFLLVPSICEEGIYPLGERGIEAFAGHVHSKAERPLHENSTLLDKKTKDRLIDLCEKIDPKMGLGFKRIAAMVVLYRNAPNNIPILFRGNEQQTPFAGIFPRTTDLPLADLG
jgi:hypothetical protein